MKKLGPESGREFSVSKEDEYRFLGKVKVDLFTGCWEWIGHHNKDGYSLMRIKGSQFPIHRVSWVIHNGQIPKEHVIDHLCSNPGCCNPIILKLLPKKSIRREHL